jgi:hypothetical protein
MRNRLVAGLVAALASLAVWWALPPATVSEPPARSPAALKSAATRASAAPGYGAHADLHGHQG